MYSSASGYTVTGRPCASSRRMRLSRSGRSVMGLSRIGRTFGRRARQAQRELLFQNQREGRAGMLARHVALVAAPFKAAARRRTEGERYSGGVNGEAKHIPIEFDLRADVNVVLATRGDEAIAVGTQELCGLEESQARKRVEQRPLGARLRHRAMWEVMTFSLRRTNEFYLAADCFHQ